MAPTAEGTFDKTPLSNLLIYALERGLSGTFELSLNEASVATLLFIEGFPAKIRTTEPGHFLGEVMADLGLITGEQLAASLERLQESPRLQGEILIELGFATEQMVQAGLRGHLDRKLEQLFSLPQETAFAYFDGVDNLARFGGPPVQIDPLPALWRGVRQSPSWEHVDATLRRLGALGVRLTANAQVSRFQFGRNELAAIELFQQKPLRVIDLANSKIVGPSVAQLLVYCLLITKQVELVEVVAEKPASSPQPQVQPATPPSSGQAFARVQLQAKPVVRTPLVIEEMPVNRSASDSRISSPMPAPIPLPDEVRPATNANPPPALPGAASNLDIGSMISTTIQSSLPPPMTAAAAVSVAPEPTSSPAMNVHEAVTAPPPVESSPSLPSEPAPLTAEQSTLKNKILERAITISGQDYFQMLGVDRDATAEAVQKAFIQLAKVWHPDRLPAALVDVKEACSKVFSHLTEANATLSDPERRQEYMTLIKEGGATPDDQAKIQAVVEAATDFQKAEFHLKRNDVNQAYELVKKAWALDPEQADYLAMMTWLEAQKPEFVGREKTLEKIAVLDKCVKMNAHCERAIFWRGMLYKRIDEGARAVKDFKRAADLNPRNLDALREVRLHNMRGGASKPPPGPGGSMRPSAKPPAGNETLGGLFGKLFKK
ncbi:PT repeat/DnaJ domain/tetratricopeptide repeat protein [Labilithrix luteola]|uniref:PT repeat/DnaJ domain/tetratricopeptide repeat protein n=1 Tax=Labilithrix luteola TaxID=1391654 RepID=A0A0K1PT68_9BACT|nr:PT repeat/DnaJ domain/tetratricopeptide repeat protein [Labilithrix luteola]